LNYAVAIIYYFSDLAQALHLPLFLRDFIMVGDASFRQLFCSDLL
jgi:hypothetical protein